MKDTQHQQVDLLNLTVTQIKCILADGSKSINELTDAFVNVAQLIESLNQSANTNDAELERLAYLHQKVQQGIIAFQFYDRISQRLEHAGDGLTKMTEVIQASSDEHSALWHALKSHIRNGYSLESERRVFDQIMQGATIEDALQRYLEQDLSEPDSDDIELF